ncbi:BACON domain-containing protein [Alistipes sp.]|uniref:BACON domain-containing protein n=1 Tax=Alistipes sp. TaxID=1872444 RepID=UPI0025C5EA3A|nr:BACON domain-containing protein [Alistipes sp.]
MKRSVTQTNDGYYVLLDAFYFNGKRLGNISEEGVDWGGDNAQTFELWAAQIRSNPVLDIETRAATNEITGKMIEMVPSNCVDLMGGKAIGEEWQMPANSLRAEGDVRILTGTGKTIKIKRASLRASKIRGGLGGEKNIGIEFGLKMLAPKDGSSPGSMLPTEPFIEAEPTALTFGADGGSKAVAIEASGPFSVGVVPEGFSVELVNGRVTVIAEANATGSPRSGRLEFILESDVETKASVTLSQPNNA